MIKCFNQGKTNYGEFQLTILKRSDENILFWALDIYYRLQISDLVKYDKTNFPN